MKKFAADPLAEEKYSPLPGLIHKYSNRVLVMVTFRCAGYCAFCTRRRMRGSEFEINEEQILAIKKYLLNHKKVNEVIFSGGDPLMAPDNLSAAMRVLGALPQIKVLRVHTRLPVSAPGKINNAVLAALKKIKNKPLYIVIHANHPDEIDNKVVGAIKKLQKVSTMVLSHAVLLKGVNDSVEVLEKLFNQLVEIGVKPYYLFHCDPVAGAEQFIVDYKKEIKIVSELRRRLSGLAYPNYVTEAPGGSGKVPVPLDFWDFDSRYFRDFNGKKIRTA